MGFAPTALRIGSGVVVWSVHFALAYGGTALACARGAPAAVPWIVLGAGLAGAALCVLVIVSERRRATGFESWLAASIAAVALAAIAWETLPLLWVTPCAA